MIAALLGVIAVAAPDGLVPDRAEVDAELGETAARIGRAEALGRTLFTLQNTWAARVRDEGTPTCDDPLGPRLREAGVAHRDAAQSARAQSERMVALLEVPTIAPLLTAADSRRVADLDARLQLQVTRHLEAQAWSERVVEPTLRRCDRGRAP